VLASCTFAFSASYGILDGNWMWVETPRGRMQQKAKLTIAIDPRVIHVEHGWWFPEEPPDHGIWKSNANLLIDDQPPCDPAMGTYQLPGLLCRVTAA
jgi:anaerobic selenocysteine-containing dehydrogenase